MKQLNYEKHKKNSLSVNTKARRTKTGFLKQKEQTCIRNLIEERKEIFAGASYYKIHVELFFGESERDNHLGRECW